MKHSLLLLTAIATPASGQTVWANGSRSVSWIATPVVGDGVNRVAEIFNTTQGGDPPATLTEPAAIDGGTTYTVTDWITNTAIDRITGSPGTVEGKFRIPCNHAFLGTFDPIVFPGVAAPVGHPHSFAGNRNITPNTTYASGRASPSSTCAGGPGWSQGYWFPQLLYQVRSGVYAAVIENNNTFYYHEDPGKSDTLSRLLRGSRFIAGVNPSDIMNTARLAEIPNGQGWDKTKRYNGWEGWNCVKVANSDGATTQIHPDVGSTADVNPETDFPRKLQNDDGTDPWESGTCEPGAGYKLILVANLDSPKCSDGITPITGDGRGGWRYPIRKLDSSAVDVCPDGSWRVATFSDKTEFSNYGKAWRKKLVLSSDLMVSAAPGSTWHADWMMLVDDYPFRRMESQCIGETIDGVAGVQATCGNGTISATERLKGNGDAPPVGGLSNNPIVSLTYLSTGPSKRQYGPLTPGSVVNMTINHPHMAH
jgi:hypothetical protein